MKEVESKMIEVMNATLKAYNSAVDKDDMKIAKFFMDQYSAQASMAMTVVGKRVDIVTEGNELKAVFIEW